MYIIIYYAIHLLTVEVISIYTMMDILEIQIILHYTHGPVAYAKFVCRGGGYHMYNFFSYNSIISLKFFHMGAGLNYSPSRRYTIATVLEDRVVSSVYRGLL